jgi:hypothetical protein
MRLLRFDRNDPEGVTGEGSGSDDLRLPVLKEAHGGVRSGDIQGFAIRLIYDLKRAGASSVHLGHGAFQLTPDIDFRGVTGFESQDPGRSTVVFVGECGIGERDGAQAEGLDDDEVSYD